MPSNGDRPRWTLEHRTALHLLNTHFTYASTINKHATVARIFNYTFEAELRDDFPNGRTVENIRDDYRAARGKMAGRSNMWKGITASRLNNEQLQRQRDVMVRLRQSVQALGLNVSVQEVTKENNGDGDAVSQATTAGGTTSTARATQDDHTNRSTPQSYMMNNDTSASADWNAFSANAAAPSSPTANVNTVADHSGQEQTALIGLNGPSSNDLNMTNTIPFVPSNAAETTLSGPSVSPINNLTLAGPAPGAKYYVAEQIIYNTEPYGFDDRPPSVRRTYDAVDQEVEASPPLPMLHTKGAFSGRADVVPFNSDVYRRSGKVYRTAGLNPRFVQDVLMCDADSCPVCRDETSPPLQQALADIARLQGRPFVHATELLTPEHLLYGVFQRPMGYPDVLPIPRHLWQSTARFCEGDGSTVLKEVMVCHGDGCEYCRPGGPVLV